MGSEGLINVCQAVAHGHIRKIRNTRTNQYGTIIDVAGNGFTVLVETASVVWAYEDCEEQLTG